MREEGKDCTSDQFLYTPEMPDLHTSTYNRTDTNKWWLLILAAFFPLKHTPEVTAITETFGRLGHLMTITGILEGKGTLRAGQTAMQLQTLSQPQSPLHTLHMPARGRWMGRLWLGVPRLTHTHAAPPSAPWFRLAQFSHPLQKDISWLSWVWFPRMWDSQKPRLLQEKRWLKR